MWSARMSWRGTNYFLQRPHRKPTQALMADPSFSGRLWELRRAGATTEEIIRELANVLAERAEGARK